MPELDTGSLVIVGITFVAALVNGGLGYGFSSITVPVALLFVANRVLNPALVLVEVGVNVVCLVANRKALPRVAPRIVPMLGGLVPGIAVGSLALASVDSGALRLVTFALLLPLILAQTAGFTWPIRNERLAGAPLGAGIGLLYAATTISGPPLALLLNNQGLSKDDFRAALGLFRVVESVLTAIAYVALGLFARDAVALAGTIAPGAAIGFALGFLALRRIGSETFRRVCMGLDGLLVAGGLARLLVDRGFVPPIAGWALVGVVVLIEAVLLIRFLAQLHQKIEPAETSLAEGVS